MSWRKVFFVMNPIKAIFLRAHFDMLVTKIDYITRVLSSNINKKQEQYIHDVFIGIYFLEKYLPDIGC